MKKHDIIIIGLSSQKDKKGHELLPLDIKTNSGKFIKQIEDELAHLTFHKTNLVKYVPLDKENKIRYPTIEEFNSCFNHLESEIEKVNPKIIILLGEKVANFITKKYKIEKEKYKATQYKDKQIICIDHPSYLMIYKRKQIENYSDKIIKLINDCL